MPAAKIKHEPFNPVRLGHDGERIFFEAWRQIADQVFELWDGSTRTTFEEMFLAYRWEAGQREATVAASLICWLGTNCGKAFVVDAKRLATKLAPMPMDTAFLMAWADENARRIGINRQLRVIEHLLTPIQDMDDAQAEPNFVHWDKIGQPSAKDYEAAECVVRWLASDSGLKLLEQCETAMKHSRLHRSLLRMEESGMGDTKPAHDLRRQLAAA